MAKINGTSGNDFLNGTKKNDLIKGKGGLDQLLGLGGNDLLDGGGGVDFLIGGVCKDELLGRSGNDFFQPGGGKDFIDGGKGPEDVVGYAGSAKDGKATGYDLHDIRQATLWGTLLAGGGGVEYYFGYQLPENDLLCEDFRSRDKSWDYCRIALEFFAREKIPVERMANADDLVGNRAHDNSRYCFAEPGQLYLVYLPKGGSAELDLSAASGEFSVAWFNPRSGGNLQPGPHVRGPKASLAAPSTDDWLAVVRK